MIEAVSTFFDSVLGNLIGGSGSTPIWVAGLVILMLLVIVLLTARVGFDVALIIVTPGVIVASFAGYLPMMSFGVIVILLAITWAAIISALTR